MLIFLAEAVYKRLEQGVFHLPSTDQACLEIDTIRLTLILEGLDFTQAIQRKRFAL